MGREAEGICAVGEKTVDGEVEKANLKQLWVGRKGTTFLVFTWSGNRTRK